MAFLLSAIKIHGGKHYMARRIISLMPKHCHYVEPYAGGLSVLLNRDPEDKNLWLASHPGVSEVVNDLNQDLTNFWQVLQDVKSFAEFHRIIEAVPFSQIEFERAQKLLSPKQDPVSRAVCFFIIARQSRAGSFRSFTPITKTRTRARMNNEASAWTHAIAGLSRIHSRLRRVVIINNDALKVIEQHDTEGTLFYLDPPYPHETRTTKNAYQHEMSTKDHLKLLQLIQTLKAKVIISSYPNEQYDKELSKWRRMLIQQPNHVSGEVIKGYKIEAIYINYVPEVTK